MQLKDMTPLEKQLYETIGVVEKQPPSDAATRLVMLLGDSCNELQRLRGQRDLLLKEVRESIQMLSQSVGVPQILCRELLQKLSVAHQEIKL
jgi:hypothetical protein